MKIPEKKVWQLKMILFLHVRNCIGVSTLVNSWIATIPCKNERILSGLSTKLVCGNAEFKK